MPLFLEELTEQLPRVVVGGSVAVELDWALSAVRRPEFKRDHAVLDRVFTHSPELLERVRNFWGPAEAASCGGSVDITVLAHHAGLLFTLEAGRLLEKLEETCADPPRDLRLGSESAADRAALMARLARLASSPGARRDYVGLISDVWSALSADWERDGRPAVEASVAARAELSRRGASWREVAGSVKWCDEDLLGTLAGSVGPGGVIAVVPAFFAHVGSFVELPGALVIGVRASPPGQQARARTELLARRLKTISDPTRLAILEAVRGSPLTVTEIASQFALAQPTVSNHVKLLREAGILVNRTEGGRRVLTVQAEVLADLVDNLGSMFALSGRQPAGGR